MAGWYRKLILNMLHPMQKGHLRMTFPDGSVAHFGVPDAAHSAEIHIRSENVFRRAVFYGDIGFAEAYMHGEWETPDLTALLAWFLLNIDNAPTLSGGAPQRIAANILQLVNRIRHSRKRNSISGSKKNIADHYDLSNDFFHLFLDRTMTYSSALYDHPEMDLETAQLAKYDSLCRSLKLNTADHVLEIGTGWGGFAEYAATHYGCRITTVTISAEQYKYAVERMQRKGLDTQVQVLLCDYRKIKGTFDKVVSIEMIEAVGARYLPAYFKKIQSVLKPHGVLGLQAIICPDNRFEDLKRNVDFIQKHIFPGSLLPSIAAINNAVNTTGDMFMFGLKDLGKSYAVTLSEWRRRFNENIAEVKDLGYDEVFIRKWNYYFSYCEAAFAMRNINVVQMVYARPNNYHY